ncbi:hypothetical protein NO1_0562 [Candidatus Termititenax aidoneus]|uniref:Uncharacterized protein n=1 Tax=Termititenax aidoneus TaxID=2218524 RepID=A0A388TA44_TERA1|nr:hypothetical protein NO1_0562 [Candidatus Termititenax aidoneus]
MGTTLEEFKGIGIDTESKEFLAGIKYGRNLRAEKFKTCVGFIRYWANLNERKIKAVKEAA